MLAELQSLNESWTRAWFEKDVALVERLMADDYVYVAPNGQVLDRQAILGIIRSPTYHLHHGTRTEVVVRALGRDAGIIRHRWQGDGTFEGTSFKDDHRCVMVCARQGAEWQIVMEQCTGNRP
jgi:ketosteroid isomerase-like protein